VEGKRFLKDTISSTLCREQARNLQSLRSGHLPVPSSPSSPSKLTSQSRGRLLSGQKSLYKCNNCRKGPTLNGLGSLRGKPLRNAQKSFVGPGSYNLTQMIGQKIASSRNKSTIGGVFSQEGKQLKAGTKKMNPQNQGKDAPGIGKYNAKSVARSVISHKFGSEQKQSATSILTRNLPASYLGLALPQISTRGQKMGQDRRFNYQLDSLKQQLQNPGPGTAEHVSSFKAKALVSVTYARLGRRTEDRVRDRFQEGGEGRPGKDSPGAIYQVAGPPPDTHASFGSDQRFPARVHEQGPHAYLSNAPKTYGSRQQPGPSFSIGRRELDLDSMPDHTSKGYAGIAW